MWANKSLCVTGRSHTPPRRRGSFSMHHLVMLPPLFLHLHPASVVLYMHIVLHFFFFWLKKEPGYDGAVALASKVQLLQHGRGD